jgi:uncharacterized membrane protein HdeD (DUF308 family)
MLRVMIANWWLFACRAAFALIFSLYVLFVQGANLPLLLRAFAHASTVVLFGLLAFGAGIFTLAAALRRSSHGVERRLLIADGLGACAAGAIVVLVPSLTLLHLVKIIGFWAVFAGLCELLMAQKIRRHLPEEWLLVLAGTGSLGFGAFLLLGWPTTDDSAVLAWLGSYALFSAVCMAGLAYRLQRISVLPHAGGSSSMRPDVHEHPPEQPKYVSHGTV